MSVIDLLSRLRSLDVRLWSEDDRLCYSSPPGVVTPALRSELSTHKTELLAFLKEAQTSGRKPTPTISPVSRDEPLLLSFAQERLWFLDQLGPGNTAYGLSFAVCLQGPLDTATLARSVNEIIRRHENLRSSFVYVDGQPRQLITPELTIDLPMVDLLLVSEHAQEVEIRWLANQVAHQPFNLAEGPLLRAALLRLNECMHWALFTIHHIVYDGWSLVVFMRELVELYAARATGKPAPLPPLPVQYVDVAAWQRRWLQGETLETLLGYWRKQLAQAPRALNLPTDALGQTLRSARQQLSLSGPLLQSLKTLGQQAGCTSFMVLLAAFGLLLQRLSGQEDVLVGVPIANRNPRETEELIGLFVNTLVLRLDFSENPGFRELLSRVREMTLEAYAHQGLPFEKLVAELQPERRLDRNPLFDVLFNFANIPQLSRQVSDLAFSVEDLTEPESKFLMTLYVDDCESAFNFKLVYRRDLFSTERMACFLDQFHYLLEQVVADPASPISTYSLARPDMSALPDPTVTLIKPRYELITHMFAMWVARQPSFPAIQQDGQVWSYSELAARVQELAGGLSKRGVESGNVVAVTGQRSLGLMVSMLAVLWNGGRLLTLDPHLPAARQQFMLQASSARHILSVNRRGEAESEVVRGLSPDNRLRVDPDTGRMDSLLSLPTDRVDSPLGPNWDDAAYVFFTSGTTGVPKGIVGTHQGLSHFLTWQRETFAIGVQDRCAQLTALSFDVVLRDVFLPLVSGATLCLPSQEYFEPNYLLPWLEAEGISVLHTVPALAHSWLAHVPPTITLRTLRWVFFAGEPLTSTLVQRWRRAFPQAGEVINLYGPTETTLAKCFYQVPVDVSPGIQPVGYPLPHSQALVLAGNRLCGVGEPGEIVLRTPFRSLGYVNAPEENRQRFVQNPFRPDGYDLIYRTGDRGRYRPDGALEILGRLDHQIKIRGMRVELEEIGSVLSQHPAVRQAVVIVRENGSCDTGEPPQGAGGELGLVAYVVFAQLPGPTVSELRHFLKEKLPSYMVPAIYVPLEALPLLPNGKVDRNTLPAPTNYLTASDTSYTPPQNELERAIAAVWQAALQVDKVGIHDNFFELGGHSLMLIEVQSEIRKFLKQELSVVDLFQYPTISALAAYLSQRQDERPSFQQSQLRAEARRQSLQQRRPRRPFS